MQTDLTLSVREVEKFTAQLAERRPRAPLSAAFTDSPQFQKLVQDHIGRALSATDSADFALEIKVLVEKVAEIGVRIGYNRCIN